MWEADGVSVTGPLFTLVGAGSLWTAWLCSTGRLKRNGFVGMRTKATMATDAAWHAAHRASAWSLAMTGLVLLGTGTWLLASGRSASSERNVVVGVSILSLIVISIGGLQAHQVAKDVAR